jgi:hypothetical protein
MHANVNSVRYMTEMEHKLKRKIVSRVALVIMFISNLVIKVRVNCVRLLEEESSR